MKKPEKKEMPSHTFDEWNSGYNAGLAAMEKYYKWRMETSSKIIARKIAKRIGGTQ